MYETRLLLPQTLQKEIQGHQPRIDDILERSHSLLKDNESTADSVQQRLADLQRLWRQLNEEAELRHQRLAEAREAQQFYFDAAEAEAWMSEQELYMMSEEKAKVGGASGVGHWGVTCVTGFIVLVQDEQSSVSMLKKHQMMEQAVEDYAQNVHQLSKTSRGLVSRGHIDRYVNVNVHDQLILAWVCC